MVIEQQITGAIITGIKELYGADVAANQETTAKDKERVQRTSDSGCFSLPPHVEEISGTDCP